MRRCVWLGVMVLGVVAATAQAQAGGGVVVNAPGQAVYWSAPGMNPAGAKEITVDRLRQLRLTDEQIQKFEILRRDIEKERVAIDAQVKAAQQAAAAANAEVARLQRDLQTLLSQKTVKVLESVMTEDQVKAWRQQDATDQAKQWLQGYKGWLKLTEPQVEEISSLLVSVFQRYNQMETDLEAARKGLSELRLADRPDVAAIDAAEKKVGELAMPNVYGKRQEELMERMAPVLLPDQLEKLNRMRPRH